MPIVAYSMRYVLCTLEGGQGVLRNRVLVPFVLETRALTFPLVDALVASMSQTFFCDACSLPG